MSRIVRPSSAARDRARARNRLNPFDRRVLECEAAVGQHVREDDELEGGVGTVHVEGGISLGDAQVLGLGENVLVVESLGGHPGENEVRGAVEDAPEPR